MQARRLLVIVNGRGSRADQDLDEPLRILRDAGCDPQLERPDEPGGISDLVRRHARRFDAVVLGGGDGTLSRALAALLETHRPLGILPLGTANDLARSLDIPLEPAAAAAVIARGRLRAIDVGRVDGTLFVNAAALGLSTRVARRLDRQTKRRWGVLSYAVEGARIVWERRAFRAEVRCGGATHVLRSIQIHVANGRSYGGGLLASEDARVDDGRLVLLSVRPRPLLALLRVLPSLRAGRHDPRGPSYVLHGTEFEIRTRYPHEISTDGELTGCATPVRIDQLRHALRVYVPEGASEDPSEASSDEAPGGR